MSGRGRANATLSGLLTRIPGRSGRIWEPHTVQLRPGHLRSSGAAAVRATRLVKDEDADAYGALRVFPNRRQRGRAAALLAAGNPVMPALLDIVDHPGLPPALVTAWSPGASSTPLHALRERDDLDTMLAAGHRWSPAEALHTLVPLGRALDDMARAGFTPLELSPDHLVLNSGSLAFVGLGRHGYIPSEGRMPGPQGMSLPSALLLGEDLPPAGGSHDTAVRWREVQVRALTRLAGWMACGLPPAAWGPVHGPADLGGYLEAAGFQRVPALRPGQLADTLARAAGQEEEARALRDFAEAEALLVYDDAAQGSGGGRLDINPEVLRLGLLHDHGAKVIALAAFEQRRLGTRTATLLSGAGWVLLSPKDFATQVCRAASAAPRARLVVAGRLDPEDQRRIEAVRGGRAERVNPDDLSGAVPRIAGRPADQLPYLTDRDMDAYSADLLGGVGGQAMRRRTFAAGWTLALGGAADQLQSRQRGKLLDQMTDCFGTNTELLVAVRARQNAPGMRKQNRLLDEARMRRLVAALSGVPGSVFRDCLMSALLGPAAEDLYDESARRLLPVATRLAAVFDPDRPVGTEDLPMEDALRERAGIRRVGLYGRLCTAVTGVDPARLAAAVASMDDTLVGALCEIPAPSLQFLAGRLEDPELFELLRPLLQGDDLDLLTRYTPQMWRTLLDGLRQPEHLGSLGLGWVQIAVQDTAGDVDARVLLRIAADAGVPGPDAVRALLGTGPEHWPTVCAHPVLAARWLAEQGDLDLAEIVAAFPDPEAALAEIGTDGLRHAHELGLDQQAMSVLGGYARALAHPLDEVLVAFQERGYESGQAAPFATAAAVEWSRMQRDRGKALGWIVGNVVERPRRIRDWAVDGTGLTRRVTEAVLGEREAGDAASVPDTLRSAPALLPLLAGLGTPRQRAALLALYAEEPQAVLDPRARRELPMVLAAPDPAAALRVLLREGLGVIAQQFADRLRLSPEQRRSLAGLAPLTEVLAPPSLEAVLTVGVRFGPRVAVSAAVVEQRLPGVADSLTVWGPRWLPLLAGAAGQRVLRLLVEQREQHGGQSGRLSPWLLAAGEDGLALVERFGSDALGLVLATDAPPADARLLGELLMLPGPAPVLHRLITGYGLPPATWSRAAALLARGEPEERVLLRLWGRGGGAPVTAAAG
ncbi:hypothetical protein [Streptomyces sp. NBC_01257]|uniref:hypothetical protein n=1 Tax=Streptomyces sp. NBC_01257 TaxID=2903799 RepID=UPI002DDB16B9|nr:hypothetical protein [Streptomyces sp. NBC_01257]WRZ65155.1 hypothetical protein OG408_15225 [Streptomyces sp. NBC_01257]